MILEITSMTIDYFNKPFPKASDCRKNKMLSIMTCLGLSVSGSDMVGLDLQMFLIFVTSLLHENVSTVGSCI